MVTEVVVAKVLFAPICKVPEVIVVLPAYTEPPDKSSVPVPDCIMPAEDGMPPVRTVLPLPALINCPPGKLIALETTRLPLPEAVKVPAVIVPPPSVTVPVVLETLTIPANTPEFVTVMGESAAASPNVTLSSVVKAMLTPGFVTCCQLALVVFQALSCEPLQIRL